MLQINRRVTKQYFHLARLKYAPLIAKLSTFISVDSTHSDDLRACADDELLKCMICYDGSGSFITFLYCRLRGVFRHMRDTELRAKRAQSMPPEYMANFAGSCGDLDARMTIKECLACLNEEETTVITELFFKQKTTREVSDSHGVVPSTVCRIKTRAINKMKKQFGMELT